MSEVFSYGIIFNANRLNSPKANWQTEIKKKKQTWFTYTLSTKEPLNFFHYLFIYFIVVQLQLSVFSPHHYLSTQAKPTSLPCFHPSPWFCPRVLYSSSWKPPSPLSFPHSPLAIVRLFLTSMSLVIFCLLFSFVDYIPVIKRERDKKREKDRRTFVVHRTMGKLRTLLKY